jgi:hypothetical protein
MHFVQEIMKEAKQKQDAGGGGVKSIMGLVHAMEKWMIEFFDNNGFWGYGSRCQMCCVCVCLCVCSHMVACTQPSIHTVCARTCARAHTHHALTGACNP